ncbi:universal stress protein [Bacteroides sp. An322]|jgi:nucleotide-binding universal stress UspA family protein|uniref:universal stress protein n=1 Tax=Bacteroides sp. An322 TaxID=1965632 RepID=UPI000B39939B|nr:universal stress protein [Bacteroides sp. An322]OUO23807.1 universal stress protein [Bacteroides sp. An322]HJC98706.1 universal stress protein [Candidatus Phocaeicola merdavium]
MEDKLITLAILTYSKAQILQSVLENEGIESYIHNVNLIQPVISSGVRVRIKESDLPQALKIIESSSWLSSEILQEESPEPAKASHVLIPIDFSAYSLKACDFGFRVAAKMQVEVVLLHVHFTPIYIPSLQYSTDHYGIPPIENSASIRSVIETIHKELDDLVKVIDKKIEDGIYPKVKYTCMLREGVPEEEILSYARHEKPLIIVMGTRGEHQKDLELIGSVTAEVIERSPVFVYAIPEQAPSKSIEDIHKVALFTSFDQRDLIAFDSLITTFKDNHFEVTFIHINSHEQKRTWNEITLAGIKEYFKKQYPQLEFNYLTVDEEHLLNNLDQFVQENKIDVICTSNYKRNIFARLFNPSIARKMLFHANTPLLVIK